MHICPADGKYSAVAAGRRTGARPFKPNHMAGYEIPPLNKESLHISTGIMRALAHPLRLRMLQLLLRQQSACVQTLYSDLRIEQAVASQHLRILRQAGLVHTERRGKFIHYLPNPERLIKAGLIAGQLADGPDAALPEHSGKKGLEKDGHP